MKISDCERIKTRRWQKLPCYLLLIFVFVLYLSSSAIAATITVVNYSGQDINAFYCAVANPSKSMPIKWIYEGYIPSGDSKTIDLGNIRYWHLRARYSDGQDRQTVNPADTDNYNRVIIRSDYSFYFESSQ